MANDTVKSGRIVARTVPELLQIVEAKPGVSNPAIVRLTLRNGLQFEGRISSYDARKGVCVIEGENGKSSIIDIGEIAAVTVLHPGAAKTALQGGLVYREEGDEAPTFIALRRTAESLSKQYNTGISMLLPESESENLDCRFAANRMLSALDNALKDVNSDKLGQDAIAGFRDGIRLSHQAGASVLAKRAEKKAIDVQFDCLAPLSQGYESRLTDAIKKLL